VGFCEDRACDLFVKYKTPSQLAIAELNREALGIGARVVALIPPRIISLGNYGRLQNFVTNAWLEKIQVDVADSAPAV
jgi:hypothetical protein